MTKKRFLTGACILTSILLLMIPIRITAGQPAGSENSGREEYFSLLTEDEKNYLAEKRVISVVVSARKGPIQYVDSEGTQRGISVDLLEEVSKISGMEFEYITMEGMREIQGKINSGEIQMVSGVPKEEAVSEAYDITFSDVYLNCAYGVVLERGKTLQQMETLTLALTAGLDVPEAFQGVKEIKNYDSIQDCINAVNRGEADFTYGNAYVLEFYSQGYELQKLCVIPLDGDMQSLCFGVSNLEEAYLVSLLNKALEYLGKEKLLNITITNVAVSTQSVTLVSLIAHNPGWSLLLGLLFVGLIFTIALLEVRNSRHKSRLALIEHQRYLMVSAVAKDYFFEYHVRTDTLVMSPDMAELFKCKSVLHKCKSQMQKYADRYGFCAEKFFDISADGSADMNTEYREIKLSVTEGEERWFKITRIAVYEKGKISHIVGKLTDIQKDYEERETLMRKSLSDGLTELYNIAAVSELINRLLKKQHGGSFFIVDIDFFKSINDQWGHQKGDEVLIRFANILKTVFRSEDIVGRIGGDEFVVFAKDASDDSFITKKCLLLKELMGKIPVQDGFTLTISIGVAKATPQSDFTSLYHDADAALYMVKNSGRNGYKIV